MVLLNVTGDPAVISRAGGPVPWQVDPARPLALQLDSLKGSLRIDGPGFDGYSLHHANEPRGGAATPGVQLDLMRAPRDLGLVGQSWVYVRSTARQVHSAAPAPASAPQPASIGGLSATELERLNTLAAKLGHLDDAQLRTLLHLADRVGRGGACSHCGRDNSETASHYYYDDDEGPPYGAPGGGAAHGVQRGSAAPRAHPPGGAPRQSFAFGAPARDDDYYYEYDSALSDGFAPRASAQSWDPLAPRTAPRPQPQLQPQLQPQPQPQPHQPRGGPAAHAQRLSRSRSRSRSAGPSWADTGSSHFWHSFVREWGDLTSRIGSDLLMRGVCHSVLLRIARRQDDNLRRYDMLPEVMEVRPAALSSAAERSSAYVSGVHPSTALPPSMPAQYSGASPQPCPPSACRHTSPSPVGGYLLSEAPPSASGFHF
eukprot:TRINITY_DN8572_c1_g1_i1.p1 TRINITY_DN8572_c1_g1~~TRINITY_DN8572_c1_g1_i1.p1  ORF type:complete len:454 (+),score=79.83 TRINITY_DN8572_c1_g1_i1:80-1363(+)